MEDTRTKMTNGKSVTNLDIWDRLERLRIELARQIADTSRDHKAELADLRRQFETLEAGRLTRAEGNIQELRLEVQKVINRFNSALDGSKQVEGTLNLKVAAIYSVIIIIVTAFISALALKAIGVIH